MSTAVQFAELVPVTESPFVTTVRLRARRRALWLRELWSADANVRNLAITHNEVDRILSDPNETARAEIDFYESNPEALELTRLIVLADQDAAADPRWQTVQQCFHLSQAECDLLALCATIAADPTFGRVCGYLQDDANACYATQLLAAALFDWSPGERVCQGSMLVHWHLASVPESSTAAAATYAPWIADPAIVQWLQGQALHEPGLAKSSQHFLRDQVAAMECLQPQTLDAMREFLVKVRGGPSGSLPIEIELIAPEGSGKRTLAAQLCAEFGADLLAVDSRVLLAKELSPAQITEHAVRAARAARLRAAVLYYDHADVLDSQVRKTIAGLSELTFFGSSGIGPAQVNSAVVRQRFRLSPLTQRQRVRVWQSHSDEAVPEVVRDWSLYPAEICAATQVACAGAEVVRATCRRMLHQEPGELFTPLTCPYTWDDIVLTSALQTQLQELAAQAKLRAAVLEDWGFERLVPMGRGISALFAGPSGTGKTMAAQVLARELQRELLRVDLAEVVNKYIGETEKRLKRVFEVCERSAVVLFFDEADALFGQRTQVREAHDRYANIQIDYLLQRMEQFDGIAILASNRKSDLDPAFLRRLRFIVDFLPPGPQERLVLWRKALAERSPAGEELLDSIDWNWLSENLIMTGADIKATALAAAFLAKSRDVRIGMEHLQHAAKREMSKHGTSWRAADWRPTPHA